MKIYEELVARDLIAQVTDEDEIRELINSGKATLRINLGSALVVCSALNFNVTAADAHDAQSAVHGSHACATAGCHRWSRGLRAHDGGQQPHSQEVQCVDASIEAGGLKRIDDGRPIGIV